MKPTFDNSVNVLVKAYLNDTLKHGSCTACAVGNLIAAAMNTGCGDGFNFSNGVSSDWGEVVFYGKIYEPSGRPVYQRGLEQIQLTGYTVKEIARIELAFERECDDDMFNGLMFVVDALADIHGVDLKVKEEAKLMFVK